MTLVMPWSHPIRYQVPGTTHHAACRAGLTTNQHRPTINKSINDRTIVHRLGLDRFLAEMAEKYVPIFVFWEAFWSRLSRFYKGAHVFLHETNILRTEPRFIHGGRVFVKKPILLISAYIKTPKNEMEVPIQKALFRVSEAIFFVSETIFQNASRISRKQTMESTVFVFCFRAEVFAVEPKSHTAQAQRALFCVSEPIFQHASKISGKKLVSERIRSTKVVILFLEPKFLFSSRQESKTGLFKRQRKLTKPANDCFRQPNIFPK